MPGKVKKPRLRKRRWIAVTTGVVLLAAAIGLAWYLQSASFQDFVRRKVIATLEDVTGGRVEMASFRWNLSQLSFEATDLTIHGLEPPGQLPYVHVNRALLRLHIISFFKKEISLDQLELQRPVIHVIVHPDGTTNAPEPKLKTAVNEKPIQELFDLAIRRADLHDGMLLVNEHRIPMDFTVNDVVAGMTYDLAAKRFDGNAEVGKMDAKYPDFRDVPARAGLTFSLWHNALEVKSLKLISEQSSLELNGKLTDFNRPQVQLTYSSILNLTQLGAITRNPQLRAGSMALDGSAAYSEAAGFSSTGRVAVRDLDYLDDGLTLRKANLNTNFAFAQNRLALTRIAARLLGGQVTGEAEIDNAVSTLAAATQEKPAPVVPAGRNSRLRQTNRGNAEKSAAENDLQQRGSAKLRISGLALNELVRMLSSRALPLDKLNAAGNVAGTVNLSWRQSLADAVAELALDIAAPSQPASNQLPISGSLRGRYSLRSERMELSALGLATPQTHVQASGTLGMTTASLQLTADTTNLSEFQPLLAAMGSAPVPVELAGSINFQGTLNGRLRTPQVAGHLQATNFTYIYTAANRTPPQTIPPAGKHRSWFHLSSTPAPAPPPPPVAQPRRIHIDEFAGDIQYSPSGVALHQATIREGAAHLDIDASAALDRGNFTENSQFQVKAEIHDADIAELQRVAGTSYPLSGRLNFALQASGTESEPQGHGQFSLVEGQAHGRPIHALTAKIVFANHGAELDQIHLQAARGTVAGSAAYNFRTREVKLDLSGRSIDLADEPEIQTPHLQIAGVAEFTIKGSGTLDQPVINAHVEVASLVLNGDTVGNMTADAVTHGRQMTLSARSTFPKANFTLDGNVELQGDMPGSATLQFSNLDVNPFLPAEMRSQVTRHASLDGQAQLSGPLKQPRLLRGKLSIRQFSVEVQHLAVSSDGPVELSFADEVVSIQRCTVVSADTHFTLTGTADFKGERHLDLRANGSLNLALAHTLYPDLNSSGVVNMNAAVSGTAANPLLSGRMEIQRAGFSVTDLPAGLSEVTGTMVFNQDRLEVENLSGRMGGGYVKLGGFVTFGRTVGFNLTAEGKDIRFRYAGISVTSDQTLHLTGTLQNASLTGNITVTRFAQIPSSDLQFVLAQATAPASVPNPKSPLNNLHLEIRILSTPELTVQTTLAKLSGDVDLRLRGTGAHPVLLGRINIAEGDIKLAGTKYHLERGDVTFLDPVRIEPVLDVEATTRVRDYDITIGLHGTLERLNTTYRSDPPLSTDDIISLLAFGRTQTENAMGAAPAPGFAESASGALLGAAINQTVTSRVSKIFGGSSIRINPSLGGPENDPNARLTLEQTVSNNITFTYITNLARSAQEVIQFEYNINSEYTVQGLRDENGVVSFDLLIRKRKR